MMKRTIRYLSILLGPCILCTACGTRIDTEVGDTEVPAVVVSRTEEAATEVAVIEPGDIHRIVFATDEIIQPIEMGKTMLADLDGDGEPEKITVRSESEDDSHNQNELHFQINDVYYHGYESFSKILPISGQIFENSFYLVDLDTSDRFREILVDCDWGMADGYAYFLRYCEGELIPISGNDIPPLILSGKDCSIRGDGTVIASEFGGLFETRRVKKTWKLLDTNRFHTALEYVTEYYEYRLRPADGKLMLRQDMTFFAEKDGGMDNLITLPAGTEVDIARYYLDTGWIQFLYDGDTKEAWMKLIGDRVLLPMNIYQSDIDNYIDGFSKAG